MRKLIKLLSPLIFAAFFISCAQSVKQEGSITFDGGRIVSRAVQYAKNNNRNFIAEGGEDIDPAMVEAIKKALDFRASLSMEIKSEGSSYHDLIEEDYAVDYFSNDVFGGKTVTFSNVPVGIKATIKAKITTKITVKDEDALSVVLEYMEMPAEMLNYYSADELTQIFASMFIWDYVLYGNSELTVKEGENRVPMKLTFTSDSEDEDGIEVECTIITPEVPQTLIIKINTAKSDSKFILNKGKLVFMLLDEDGNDLAADPANASTAGAKWEYTLRLKDTVIPSTDDSVMPYVTYYTYSPGVIEISKLPASGTYQLYVQAQPLATGYTDCATTSAVFDVKVEDTIFYSFDAANLMDGNDVSSSFTAFIDSITSDAYIKISGETTSAYSEVFSKIRDYFDGDDNAVPPIPAFQYLADFDFSEMTTTAEDKWISSGYGVQNFTKLRSIILPYDLPKLADADFAHCTNLESVTFGPDIKRMGEGYDAVFMDCPKLSSVTIPSDGALQIIFGDTFSSCIIKRIELPANLLMIGANAFPSTLEELILNDESGTWYYTDSSTFTNLSAELIYQNIYNPEYQIDEANRTTLDSWIETQVNAELYDTLGKKILYASLQGKYLYKME